MLQLHRTGRAVPLSEELGTQVSTIFRDQWKVRDGEKIPEQEDLRLGNDAVRLHATVLYADMADSTKMVDCCPPNFSAEVYKAYLLCAGRIITSEGGAITAYDGDRVMAVFIGKTKNTSAVRCALKINYAVNEIINPALARQYPKANFKLQQVVGVDTSELFVARTGFRGSNDLVWVGRAANYAAKLCSLPAAGYPSWITGEVYDKILDQAKCGTNGRPMWEKCTWNAMGGIRVYRSNWQWPC